MWLAFPPQLKILEIVFKSAWCLKDARGIFILLHGFSKILGKGQRAHVNQLTLEYTVLWKQLLRLQEMAKHHPNFM